MQSNGSIIIGTITISYDRGIKRNQAKDLGLDSKPQVTPEGLPVRGMGSHWRDPEAPELVRQRNNEAARIRSEFARQFVAAPFEGSFILPEEGAGRTFLDTLEVRPDVTVCLSEYTLGVITQAPQEVNNWAGRIEKQLTEVPLGRGKNASEGGLQILRSLAACPIMGDNTRAELEALITDAQMEKVDRVDFRRKLADLKVEVGGPTVEPRRPVRPPVAPPAQPPTSSPAPPTPPISVAPRDLSRGYFPVTRSPMM